ncbi:MAG TPA: formate dehydrogenase accessory sulfurtransferase FdhD [Candidatus Udaeobacter sp.]|nr:formate dehydrogenase accessory sulfurtransferase FdhD [Candidatus Udaeobacter sp.]
MRPSRTRLAARDLVAVTLSRPPLARVAARRYQAAGGTPVVEAVAAEVPVALVYNGVSHVVMMATPQDLEDFALGFSLSEGILRRPGELAETEVVEERQGIEVRMIVDQRRFDLLASRRRNLAGRTGCGICGVDSLAAVLRPLTPLPSGSAPSLDAVRLALAALPTGQAINSQTRSIHAAAWADLEGRVQLLREDVGRHNALDKLIGAMFRAGIDTVGGFALITSRCSVEMVQKAATVGIPSLVAISAPTTLALELAEECGLRLIAQARPDSLTIYAGGPWPESEVS